MSNTETHTGTLVKFPRKENEQDKEYLQRLLEFEKKPFKEIVWDNDIQEYLEAEDIENILYYKGTFYLNKNHIELEDGDDLDTFRKTDIGIEYAVSFYNGGTYLEEVLEEGLEGLERKGVSLDVAKYYGITDEEVRAQIEATEKRGQMFVKYLDRYKGESIYNEIALAIEFGFQMALEENNKA